MKAQKMKVNPQRDGKRLNKAERKAHVEMRSARRYAVKRMLIVEGV